MDRDTSPTIRTVDQMHPRKDAIIEMVSILRNGGLVVFPTESFYALGAHAFNIRALEEVYLLKRRPRHLPLLILIEGRRSLELLVKPVAPWVNRLIEAFWPGPLTLVLPPRGGITPHLLGPTGGVAVRWSPNPVALELVAYLEAPLVGTSANISGDQPASRVEELSMSISLGVQGILDGGRTPGAVPSTVLDCTRWPPNVLREGAVSEDALNACLQNE
jgi:L-threonylcarbamoyladenylate synthase